MAYYSVFFVTPSTDSWVPDYIANVGPLIQKYGGKYLARNAGHEQFEGEGETSALMAILEWPSHAAFRSFYDDPAYSPHLKARLKGAACTAFGIEGKDDFAS